MLGQKRPFPFEVAEKCHISRRGGSESSRNDGQALFGKSLCHTLWEGWQDTARGCVLLYGLGTNSTAPPSHLDVRGGRMETEGKPWEDSSTSRLHWDQPADRTTDTL